MIRLGILCIGSELLNGAIVDTNSGTIARLLLPWGFTCRGIRACNDELESIVREIEHFKDEVDLLVISGGLGPTRDDCTRRALAEWSEHPLEHNVEADALVQEYYQKLERSRPDDCQQAVLPKGARPIPNLTGLSPGISFEENNLHIIALPGVPGELKPMIQSNVVEEIRKKFNISNVYATRDLNVFGISERQLDDMLGDEGDPEGNPSVNLCVDRGEIKIRLTSKGKSEDEANDLLLDKERILREILSVRIYGIDDDSLSQSVCAILLEMGRTLCCAESCTGGLVASLLTDLPGASNILPNSWVTYSDESKVRDLGIDASVIETHGVYSEEVARAMAECARKKAGTDFSIALTGIAGPTGGDPEHPIGLVHIAVATPEGTAHQKNVFSGSREDIKVRAARTSLNMLRIELIKLDAPHLLPDDMLD